MIQKETKIIKIIPFKGIYGKIEGTKTKVILSESTLEYRLKNTAIIILSSENKLGIEEDSEANHYINEEGIISKESINSIVRYIETQYDDNKIPYLIYYVDIGYNGIVTTIDCDNTQDRDFLYTELINWKFNKTIEKQKDEE